MLQTAEVRVNTMVSSRNLSEVTGEQIVAAYETAKGFKKIWKESEFSKLEQSLNTYRYVQVWLSKQGQTKSRPQDANRSLQKP